MLDTHAVARSLTAAEFTPAQADAITNAVRLAAEQGDHVTSDQFKAGLAEVRSEIAAVRTETAALDTRLSTQIANLDTRLLTQIANLDTRLSTRGSRRRSPAFVPRLPTSRPASSAGWSARSSRPVG